GVLDVDEGAPAAGVLGLGEDVLAERRLAGRLGAEDLGHAAARDAAHTERQVERDRSGRDDVDGRARPIAQAHDRAGPELLLDRADRRAHGFPALPLHGLPVLLGEGLVLGGRAVDGHRLAPWRAPADRFPTLPRSPRAACAWA